MRVVGEILESLFRRKEIDIWRGVNNMKFDVNKFNKDAMDEFESVFENWVINNYD